MMKMVKTLYGSVEEKLIKIAKQIELLVCDIDGVFSNGLIYMSNNFEEIKTFHARDGYGVKLLMNIGVEIAIITTRQSKIVEERMKDLGIVHVYQGRDNKLETYQSICKKLNLDSTKIGYVGDDLTDLPVMQKVALSICVADGHPLLAKHANYITKMKGGYGAIREVCDLILQSRNKLNI
nr:3-deoxy-manno-octulosonate-8-phosphatase KdsC [Candidatus Photodesmus katoptron]